MNHRLQIHKIIKKQKEQKRKRNTKKELSIVKAKMYENVILNSNINYQSNSASNFTNHLYTPLKLNNGPYYIGLKSIRYNNEHKIRFCTLTIADKENNELLVENEESKKLISNFDRRVLGVIEIVKKKNTKAIQNIDFNEINLFIDNINTSNLVGIKYIQTFFKKKEFNDFNKINDHSKEITSSKKHLHTNIKNIKQKLNDLIIKTYQKCSQNSYKTIKKDIYITNTCESITDQSDYIKEQINSSELSKYINYNQNYERIYPVNSYDIIKFDSIFKHKYDLDTIKLNFDINNKTKIKNFFIRTNITGSDIYNNDYILKILNNKKHGYTEEVFENPTFFPITKNILHNITITISDIFNQNIQFISEEPVICEIVIKNE